MDIVPLELADGADDLREKLIARGTKFEALADGWQHVVDYKGDAAELVQEDDAGVEKLMSSEATGRAIIAPKLWLKDCRDRGFADDLQIRCLTPRERDSWNEEERHIIATSFIRGYSMTFRAFVVLHISRITPITWSKKWDQDLVLAAERKKTIQDFVRNHQARQLQAAKIGEENDTGVMFILHGFPGTGKTSTAECIAELAQRPLWRISIEDLEARSKTPGKDLIHQVETASVSTAAASSPSSCPY